MTDQTRSESDRRQSPGNTGAGSRRQEQQTGGGSFQPGGQDRLQTEGFGGGSGEHDQQGLQSQGGGIDFEADQGGGESDFQPDNQGGSPGQQEGQQGQEKGTGQQGKTGMGADTRGGAQSS